MSEERAGQYPPPPHWPPHLATKYAIIPWDFIAAVEETSEVEHSYIMNGWPMPCAMFFDGHGNFLKWEPALTVERAIAKAAI